MFRPATLRLAQTQTPEFITRSHCSQLRVSAKLEDVSFDHFRHPPVPPVRPGDKFVTLQTAMCTSPDTSTLVSGRCLHLLQSTSSRMTVVANPHIPRTPVHHSDGVLRGYCTILPSSRSNTTLINGSIQNSPDWPVFAWCLLHAVR